MTRLRPNAPNPTRHPAPARTPTPWAVFDFNVPDPEAPILNARAWKTQRDHYRASLEQIYRLPLDRAGDGPAVLLAEMSRLAEEALR